MVTPRQFIQAWQESASLAEAAAKVRSNKNACRVRGYRYRQMGVPLKEFPPVEVELIDWDELAEYAASLLPRARRMMGRTTRRTTWRTARWRRRLRRLELRG